MLDLEWIREHPDDLDAALQSRGEPPCAAKLLEEDARRRHIVTHLQELQARRNRLSHGIGRAKAAGDMERYAQSLQEVSVLKDEIHKAERDSRTLTQEVEDRLAHIPNIPLDDVPYGADESDNAVLHVWGKKPDFSFAPRTHIEIGEQLGGMDFRKAAQVSGARFTFLTGALALLERALGQFMIDIHTRENGYREVSPPLLVHDTALFGTAQLPKFAQDQFQTTDGYWLIPTAEVPLTNLVRDQIIPLSEGALPLRFVALTPCFRSEVGSAGRDVGGMIRQHQFLKCELVSITKPHQSLEELERLRLCAEMILQRLELPYRVVTLCRGDMGFSAQKTYDLEVWLPGQDRYREISSCSLCGDFQARRLRARYRDEEGKTAFVHTLNGSGLAVGRTLIALLENYQDAQGGVQIPRCLQPYLNGQRYIS